MGMPTGLRLPFFAAALALLAALAAGDIAVSPDGKVVRGRIARVVFADGRTVANPAAVHLDHDRVLLDLRSLVANYRFTHARGPAKKNARVAVYMGTGAFAPSAQAVVKRLDEAGHRPRLLFDGDVDAATLKGLRAIVFPGGWAPSMLVGLREDGQKALAAYVRGGGRYLGICAGGYLPCKNVRWEGRDHPYPVALVDGVADGPVPGLAPWPKSEVVALRPGKTGRNNKKLRAIYAGGAAFSVNGARVLARYEAGSAAAIEVNAGKGRLVLIGVHPEFDATDGDILTWAGGPKVNADWFRELFKNLLR